MTELKQSRWVKIHEPGQANYAEKENIMDIKIGDRRCQADVLYTVRSYRKAGYWLCRYLEAAEAAQLLAEAAEQIMAAVGAADRDEPMVTVSTADWTCEIEKMGQGAFRASLMWQTDEQVVRKQKPASKTARKPKQKRGQGKKGGQG